MQTEQPLLTNDSGQARGHDQWLGWWPRAAVAGTVAWSLWELRATVSPAQYPDDSSVHEQMVRFAAGQIRGGHDPLTAWFPYLGLGSPQFLHYQSTPAMLTGLAGLVIGPDAAFRWSLYLLWCLWPVAIYGSARVFGLTRRAAAMAAAVAPLLHSAPGIGYEQHAYTWAGFGVWTQLWGSWALPFAWALSWRALADRRFLAPAAALVALTCAVHYETGYLAFAAIPVMPLVVPADLPARLARAAALLAASLLASAWIVVPLLYYSRWAGVNQALAGSPMANGYGARRILGWLVTGRVFDAGHLPVISLLAAAGLAAAAFAWRQAGPERALAALFAVGLLLAFGRTTFGGLADAIPGSTDLFFRRFLMGAQLAGIYLAGTGAVAAAGLGARLATAAAGFPGRRTGQLRRLAWLPAALLAAVWLIPGWRYYAAEAAVNSADIGFQELAQAGEPQVAAVAKAIRSHGPGRVYAGSAANWGQRLTVGFVPMYAYLESLDLDEVGYTLRTAALMTQPEYHFDPAQAGDYALFGIRYLVLAAGGRAAAQAGTAPAPPPGAVLILRDTLFRVYELPGNSYIRVADTVGSITANRADVGSRTAAYLRSPLPGQDRYLTVGYAGARAAAPTLGSGAGPLARPGTVLAEQINGLDDSATAIVSPAPACCRGAQLLLRSWLVGDGRRTACHDRDGRARAGRRHRATGHAQDRVPVPRVRRLPGTSCSSRPGPPHARSADPPGSGRPGLEPQANGPSPVSFHRHQGR